MARHHLKRKLRTYQSLASINRHFEAIARHVRILEYAGFMPIIKMRVFWGYVRELQAQISHDVADNMHALEDRDCFEFGKTRIAREHYLNPQRPAFKQNKPAALQTAKGGSDAGQN